MSEDNDSPKESKKMSEDNGSPKKSKKWYKQQFKSEWLDEPSFKSWLRPNNENKYGALCILCNCKLKNINKSGLRAHQKSTKHLSMCNGNNQELTDRHESSVYKNETIVDEHHADISDAISPKKVAKAELLLSAFVVEHSIPISQTERLVQVIKKICPDSTIAQNLSIEKVRASCIGEDVQENVPADVIHIFQENLFSVPCSDSTRLVFGEPDFVKLFKMSKQESETKGKRRYKKKWEIKYPWLKCSVDGEHAYCTYCNTNVLPKVYNISVHEKTKKHQDNSIRGARTALDDVIKFSMDDQTKQEMVEVSPLVFADTDLIAPSEMPKHESDRKTKRRYKEKWELQFSWLKCSDDGQKAYCTYCNTHVLPKVYNISVHEKTKKHQDNSLGATQTTLDDVFKLSMEDQEGEAEMEASIVAVHGVDMTEEVQGALTALKTKLSLLSEHLYCVEDPVALIDCLRAMSSIGSVIEKYKKLW